MGATVIFFQIMILAGLFSASCTTAKKKSDLDSLATENPLNGVLTVARPVSEDTIASLKAIADSSASQLPPDLAELPDSSSTVGESSENASVEIPEESAAPPPPALVETIPADWKRPGLNPDEVNPGDLFFDHQGPVLRKTFSLLDELPADGRGALLKQFTRSQTLRVPVTVSRKELTTLTAAVGKDLEMPTRSVALDFHTTTHEVDPDQLLLLFDQISKGESAGAIASAENLARLKKQLEATRKRLRAGETIHLVTAVSESNTIRATYPGAPVGKRDATPIRNAVAALYPHLRDLDAVKTDESVEISGNPRIVWEFKTREIKLEGERLVLGPESQTGF